MSTFFCFRSPFKWLQLFVNSWTKPKIGFWILWKKQHIFHDFSITVPWFFYDGLIVQVLHLFRGKTLLSVIDDRSLLIWRLLSICSHFCCIMTRPYRVTTTMVKIRSCHEYLEIQHAIACNLISLQLYISEYNSNVSPQWDKSTDYIPVSHLKCCAFWNIRFITSYISFRNISTFLHNQG